MRTVAFLLLSGLSYQPKNADLGVTIRIYPLSLRLLTAENQEWVEVGHGLSLSWQEVK